MIHKRKEIGIELNETTKPRAVIKRCNRDFIVRELSKDGVLPLLKNSSPLDCSVSSSAYRLFNMTKNGVTTKGAISEVARQLKLSKKYITYHGMKDRWALTSQTIGIKSGYIARDAYFEHHAIYLKEIGTSDCPLRLGGNHGNRFWIRARRCQQWPDLTHVKTIPNFYGQQRFGRNGSDQYIGHLLLTGNVYEARQSITYPPTRQLLDHVLDECHGNDKLAFLHPAMLESTRFSILQWQSYLFNKLLSSYVHTGTQIPKRLPLWQILHQQLYSEVWGDYDTIDDDFYQLTVRSSRKTVFHPLNFRFRTSENFNQVFEFDIPSGSYATIVLGQVCSPVEVRHGG